MTKAFAKPMAGLTQARAISTKFNLSPVTTSPAATLTGNASEKLLQNQPCALAV